MGVGLHASITRGEGLLLENNIVSHGLVRLFCATEGTARCNGIWPEHDFDPWDTFALEENIAADPLFCDPYAGDFTIHNDSPCAPYSQPNADCDLIGALPVACDSPMAVETTTWGRIKSAFR